MNFLAHAHLSFQQPEILVGNMISDFVKGKQQYTYPAVIQKGIRLHRLIDQFTDTHEATQQLKAFFRPAYRLYAGAFADVAYDHFLANDPAVFPTQTDLEKFAAASYAVLKNYEHLLPEPFKKMLPYMISYDWFTGYRSLDGIEKSFGGLVRRAHYITESKPAVDIFNTHYSSIKMLYHAFYPECKNFAAGQLQQLMNE
ncbi:MAG: DUF479 domain-containing protein [Bacteroidetes bacterium]|nr:DUF479 domain-containing protein [Bacteroidota bacterium]